MLGDVAVVIAVIRNRQTNRRKHPAAGLVRRRLRDHRKNNLSRFQHLDALFPLDNLTVRRENARYTHQIVVRDFRFAQRHLEARQFLAVNSYTLGEEYLGWDEALRIEAHFRFALPTKCYPAGLRHLERSQSRR